MKKGFNWIFAILLTSTFFGCSRILENEPVGSAHYYIENTRDEALMAEFPVSVFEQNGFVVVDSVVTLPANTA